MILNNFFKSISFFNTLKSNFCICFSPHCKIFLHLFFQYHIFLIGLCFIKFLLQLLNNFFQIFQFLFIFGSNCLNLSFVIIVWSSFAQHSLLNFLIHDTILIHYICKTLLVFLQILFYFYQLIILLTWRIQLVFYIYISYMRFMC